MIALFSITPALPIHAQSTELNTGIMVPLYSAPGSTWQTVLQAKLANPSVPIAVIIDPLNGPGYYNSTYAAGIRTLMEAGIIVLGYVHTSRGMRSLFDVERDIRSYLSYSINGIFFDEMSTVAGNESYYTQIDLYAKQLGYTMTVGNPGSNVSATYVGIMDVLCIYENQGIPSKGLLSTDVGIYSKQGFAEISYGIENSNSTVEQELSNYVNWIFVTNGILPNPYDTIPPYFASEVSDLNVNAQSNIVSESTTTTTSSTTTTVTTYVPIFSNSSTNSDTTTVVSSQAAQNITSLPQTSSKLNGFSSKAPSSPTTRFAPQSSENQDSASGILPIFFGLSLMFGVTVRREARLWTLRQSGKCFSIGLGYSKKLLKSVKSNLHYLFELL